MIILLSTDVSLVKQLKKIDTLKVTYSLATCQDLLITKDMECNILILDYDIISKHAIPLWDWIVEQNLFIRHILVYISDWEKQYQEFWENMHSRLDAAKYVNAIISKEKLIKAVESL